MDKKYGLFGTILSISILLTLTILGPNAVAATPVDGGDLLSWVKVGGSVDAVASGYNNHGVLFNNNPVEVTTDWTIDKDESGPSYHGFYLRVTNLDVTPEVEMDEDKLWIGITSGPVYETGTLDADVNGRIGDHIEIYIYVNVAYGVNFDEDEASWIITLII